MNKFRIGNVVKLKTDSLVIITDVNDINTSWVSFSFSNVSGTTPNKTLKEVLNDISWGMEDATLLSDNVKDYITDRLNRNFDF